MSLKVEKKRPGEIGSVDFGAGKPGLPKLQGGSKAKLTDHHLSAGLASGRGLPSGREGEPRIPAGAEAPKESEAHRSFALLDRVRDTKLEEYLDQNHTKLLELFASDENEKLKAVCCLLDSIGGLTKVLKYQKKFKELKIQDIFSFSNKIVDLSDLDFLHTFQDEDEVDIKLFDLSTDQMLIDLNDNSDYEGES